MASEALVLRTQLPTIYLRELIYPSDDQLYVDAVLEDPAHVDNFGNTLYKNYSTVEQVQAAREKARPDNLRLGIFRDGEEPMLGGIGSSIRRDGTEMGYWVRSSQTRQGIASAAVNAITAHLFETNNGRIYTKVHVDNIGSLAVMRRTGYKKQYEADEWWGIAAVYEPRRLQLNP